MQNVTYFLTKRNVELSACTYMLQGHGLFRAITGTCAIKANVSSQTQTSLHTHSNTCTYSTSTCQLCFGLDRLIPERHPHSEQFTGHFVKEKAFETGAMGSLKGLALRHYIAKVCLGTSSCSSTLYHLATARIIPVLRC